MGKPIKIFADNPDPATMNQFYEAMKQDSAVQGAIMPDVHKGYTLPIGSVVATEGMIYPAWVGYDIGCGVCATLTSFDKREIDIHREAIFKKIYETVPIGLGVHHAKIQEPWDTKQLQHTKKLATIYKDKHGELQLGSLGSGNHFIEVGYDENDGIWVVVHSGSRGVGHGVASHYMALASGGGQKEWHFGLKTDSQEGQDYIADLDFCLAFALENRLRLLNSTIASIQTFCSGGKGLSSELINRNHNHAVQKDGRWIHRKGATHAEEGMFGVIPGNMRDGSFIVIGKGNPESLCSSSHGAGRVKGRAEAKRTITLEHFQDQMREVTARVDETVLDESPGAYKNIFEVMLLQRDLVEVLHKVNPMINVKG